MPLMRVQRILSSAGVASRRESERMILEGRVAVNGAVISELGTKADPERDHISVDGRLIKVIPPRVYIVINKPKGYVCSLGDERGRPLVVDLLKGVRRRVYPVGRLDYNSEGLLILTNDGDFAQLLSHPRFHVLKTYLVKVRGNVEEETMKRLSRGVELDDGLTLPARVSLYKRREKSTWVRVVLREGRNRQIRRMFDRVGHEVLKIKRIGYGSLMLTGLAPGEYRHLTGSEVKELMRQVEGK